MQLPPHLPRARFIGQGRIEGALQWLLRQGVPWVRAPSEGERSDALLSVLPGPLGGQALDQALAERRSLVDVADADLDVYSSRAQEIAAAGITVIPGCGFSPGLVDFIIGHEIALDPAIDRVEVRVGSICDGPLRFPFLWCFEDLVAEFQMSSEQTEGGERQILPAFAGLQEEEYQGVAVESYLCASGFEDLASALGGGDLTFRTVRPRGFADFFRALDHHGLFEPDTLPLAKELLESRRMGNTSMALVDVYRGGAHQTRWHVRCHAAADAELNTIQLPTAAFALEILRLLLAGRLGPGIVRCADIGRDDDAFEQVLNGLRSVGISVKSDIFSV